MLLGAHQSIAGGYHQAIRLAHEDHCDAVQVFTKNSSQWREPEVAPEAATLFREARAGYPTAMLSHDSYLINLCSPEPELGARSEDSLRREVERCAVLGISLVVLHPGAHTGSGVEAAIQAASRRIAAVLDATAGADVSLLLENTAGQGTCIGSRFEQIGALLHAVEALSAEAPARLGVCLDTCHAFAAGYDLSSPAGFDATWAELDRHIGLARIRAFHLNDSVKPLGSHVDRHTRIGEGCLGWYPFWRLMNCPGLERIPAVLETPPRNKMRAFRPQLKRLRALVGALAPA